jgi:hypothetical protein
MHAVTKQYVDARASGLPLAGANLDSYVATTGDDANDGTAATPFRTIQRAIDAATDYDYDGLYYPIVNVADGSYGEVVTLLSCYNLLGGSYLTIVGNIAAPANVITQSFVQDNANVRVSIDLLLRLCCGIP